MVSFCFRLLHLPPVIERILIIIYILSQSESTNDRVRNFFFLTFSVLIGLGIWQILHLRSYFKKSELFF